MAKLTKSQNQLLRDIKDRPSGALAVSEGQLNTKYDLNRIQFRQLMDTSVGQGYIRTTFRPREDGERMWTCELTKEGREQLDYSVWPAALNRIFFIICGVATLVGGAIAFIEFVL